MSRTIESKERIPKRESWIRRFLRALWSKPHPPTFPEFYPGPEAITARHEIPVEQLARHRESHQIHRMTWGYFK